MSSTSCRRSWNLPILCSSSLRWVDIWGAVKTDFVRDGFWLLVSYLFALSSIAIILSSKSSTTFSRWSILFDCVWFRSFWSTISLCSCVMSPSVYFKIAFMATTLSSWSTLTISAVSLIYRTLSSSVLPADWTTLIYCSAFYYQSQIDFCLVSTFCTNAAWPLMFATTCSKKLCTSWTWECTRF